MWSPAKRRLGPQDVAALFDRRGDVDTIDGPVGEHRDHAGGHIDGDPADTVEPADLVSDGELAALACQTVDVESGGAQNVRGVLLNMELQPWWVVDLRDCREPAGARAGDFAGVKPLAGAVGLDGCLPAVIRSAPQSWRSWTRRAPLAAPRS